MTITVVVSVLLIAVAFLSLIVWLPKRQTAKIADPTARFQLENEARRTLAQVLGGIAFLAGLYFSVENLRLAAQRQTTERFTEALRSLASDNLPAKLSGVYALEQIARDSPQDYIVVYEVLAAYVRTRAAWREALRNSAKNPDDDVQAVLTVLGRRARVYGDGETFRINLTNTDLRRADLEGANLQGVNLSGAHLYPANLKGADLTNSVLREAYLMEADLAGATLQGADLWKVHAESAVLRAACFKGAALLEGNLHGADVSDARGLSEAEFGRAYHDERTRRPANWKEDCGP
jgi:uncharacterized protein YjbI with pentapeptide repeats